jgi:hypothetical protein
MMDITDIKRLSEKLLSHQWYFQRNETNAITNDTQLIHVIAKLVVDQSIEIMQLNRRLEEYEGE